MVFWNGFADWSLCTYWATSDQVPFGRIRHIEVNNDSLRVVASRRGGRGYHLVRVATYLESGGVHEACEYFLSSGAILAQDQKV